MRREFTAISVSSMIIASVAGIVFCLQLATLKPSPGFQLSEPVLWAVEVAILGAAIYIWQTHISLPGWVLGIGGIVCARVMLSLGAATVTQLGQPATDLPTAMGQMSAFAPRMCAIFFSLMICYPLRVFLPSRPERATTDARRFAESPAVKSPVAVRGDSVSDLIIVAKGESDRGQTAEAQRRSARMLGVSSQQTEVDGTIELPAPTVLQLLPQELLRERLPQIKDSQMISVPLDVILPQLREAQILVSSAQIRSWLPPGLRKVLVDAPDANEEEPSVSLPLELIVPKLPADVLALPPPSPPAWAKVDETQEVVFATA